MTLIADPTTVLSPETVPVALEFHVETVTDYPSFLALRKEWNWYDRLRAAVLRKTKATSTKTKPSGEA